MYFYFFELCHMCFGDTFCWLCNDLLWCHSFPILYTFCEAVTIHWKRSIISFGKGGQCKHPMMHFNISTITLMIHIYLRICVTLFQLQWHAALILGLLFWRPHPDQLPVLFVFPALWGNADAVWQTQIKGELPFSCSHDCLTFSVWPTRYWIQVTHMPQDC